MSEGAIQVGVARLRAGMSEATQGGGVLVEGSDTTQEGALRLASGLATATAGSEEAVGALDQFAEGAKKLQKGADAITKGAGEAQEGAEFIDKTMGDLSTNIRNNGLRRSRKLQKKLTKTAHDELDADVHEDDGPVEAGGQHVHVVDEAVVSDERHVRP